MPSITTRALFKVGDGALAITLPKAWWSYYKLKPGDRLQVVTNGKLIVQPHKCSKV